MRENTKDLLKDLKTVTIIFDENTSHSEVIEQFIEKMVKAKFAKRKEIVEHIILLAK